MLEARLSEALVLKKVLDAVKELVTDANFDCSDDGISLQAMDNSHVALVALLLRAEGFENFRCDRSLSLGINVTSLSKIVRTADNSDALTLKASDNADTLNLLFESPKNDRVGEYDLKLMDIDSEHLGIPETDFDAVVKMSSTEFQRICRDLLVLGETINIKVSKEGVAFSVEGDLGKGSVMLKQGTSIDEKEEGTTIRMTAPVVLDFSLKYLNNFTKATGLSDTVTLNLANDVPLMIEYAVGDVGYVRYYLAPKVGEEDEA